MSIYEIDAKVKELKELRDMEAEVLRSSLSWSTVISSSCRTCKASR